MTGTTRCVIYVRISKDEHRRGESIERHAEDCRDYADDHDWTVVHEFVELGIGGRGVGSSKYSKEPRPEYDAMIEWLRTDTGTTPVVVLTTEISRLYRKMNELHDLIDMARRTPLAGIHATDGNVAYDLSTTEGIYTAQGDVNAAERESGKLSDRQRRRHRHRAKAGEYIAPRRPFGYAKANRSLTIVPAEAELIRAAARQVLAGRDLRPIAAQWRKDGIKTSTGAEWQQTEIRRMLLAPRNVALREHRATGKDGNPGPPVLHEAGWEPILDEVTYRQLKVLLSDPTRLNHGSNTRTYLLAGFLRCGACGGRMAGYRRNLNQSARRKTSLPGYRCPPAPYGCLKIGRTASPLDEHLVSLIFQWLNNGAYDSAIAQRETATDTKRQQLLDELRDVEIRRTEIADALTNTGAARRSIAVLIESQAALDDRWNELTEQLRHQQGKDPRVPDERGGELARLWECWDLLRRRDLIAALLDHVVVNPTLKGAGFDPRNLDVVPGRWAQNVPADLLTFPVDDATTTPVRGQRLRDSLLAYLTDHPGAGPRQIAKAFYPDVAGDPEHLRVKTATVARALKALHKTGVVVQTQAFHGRGNPSGYEVAVA